MSEVLRGLGVMESAIGIVTLRMSDDEWSQRQGDRMLPQFTTAQLLASIASTAVQLHALVEGSHE